MIPTIFMMQLCFDAQYDELIHLYRAGELEGSMMTVTSTMIIRHFIKRG